MAGSEKALFKYVEGDNDHDLKDAITKAYLKSDFMTYLAKDAETKPRNALLSFLNVIEVIEAQKTSDTTARLVIRFPVLHDYLNPAKTLQGGMQSAIFDVITSWVIGIIRRPGFWETSGTSRTLNVTFLRPAVEGEVLLLEAELVHAGKRLALTTGKLMREKDRALISVCDHQKVNIDGPKA